MSQTQQGDNNLLTVESGTAHELLGHRTFLCRPLETSNAGVLDFSQVLHTLGGVNEEVGTGAVGALFGRHVRHMRGKMASVAYETPNLTGVTDVPSEVISQQTSSDLGIISRTNLAAFNKLGNFFVHRLSLDPKTIAERNHSVSTKSTC